MNLFKKEKENKSIVLQNQAQDGLNHDPAMIMMRKSPNNADDNDDNDDEEDESSDWKTTRKRDAFRSRAVWVH